ncbi:DUF4175 family protein [Reichenbachiella versicolor]|uniref:DUF4175 family protein n=1 Tax=Reichenbachiella versicolor TaxID=1821036 RepID=UPI000D6DF55E|nr:DUF4175 family protein [Reichenbachiella versicolor]
MSSLKLSRNIRELSNSFNIIKKNLAEYKKKYFFNQLIKNSIIFLGVVLTVFLLATTLEFSLRLDSSLRTILFYALLTGFGFALINWVAIPFYHWLKSDENLSDIEAARQIGDFFPDLDDKLLNTLQLDSQNHNDSLVNAAIEQRSHEISVFKFTKSIKKDDNKKLGKYLAVPIVVFIGILVLIPQFFTESTERIIKYNQEFEPERLFEIQINNTNLEAYRNEDFVLNIEVNGKTLPNEVFLEENGRKFKVSRNISNNYQHTFHNVQTSTEFKLIAADYISPSYKLTLINRPDIRNLQANLIYPQHIKRENELLSNVGNLTLPEGTEVQWQLKTSSTENASIQIGKATSEMKKTAEDYFTFNYRFLETENYSIQLQNQYSLNKDSISFLVDVIKDQHPSISANILQDTIMHSYIIMNGLIKDDYGLSKLHLIYESSNGQKVIPIRIDRSLTSQNFFYQLQLDSIKDLKAGNFEYYLKVWDNDGVNGAKSSRSAKYSFKIPSKGEINDKIDQKAEKTKSDLERKIEESKRINNELKQIQNELKSKNKLDWQDKKKLDNLIESKKKLEEELKELNQQNKQSNQQRQQFNEPNEKLQEKAAQLQKLMDQVLDEETKKLYEELQKLLQENTSPDKLENVVEQLQQKEENMEKELERAIEMYKRMQFDFKMEEVIDDLEKLAQEQEQNAKDTQEGNKSKEELKEKQDSINKEFEEIAQEMDKLDELNKELENPKELENFDQEEQSINESLKESSEQLEDNKKKKSSQSQQNAAQQMQQMSKKMQDMQQSMEMQQMSENLENLRAIVENLVKLSFDQEQILKDFRGVNQSDPRFVTLSQQQLKLKDDAKIIEDSLLALSKRVFQIQSFVTRELSDMNKHINESLQMLRERHQSKAVVSQQYAMTSINNLALLLDDVLKQMMAQMAEAMGKPQKGKKGKPKNAPSLSQLQKELNQKIQDLQKSGKSGRQLSQELAKLAAEQEALRNQLQQMGEKLQNGEDGKDGLKSGLNDAVKKMEQTETDLVNKRITRQTIRRQQDILTRMLKAEKAMREKELDQQRKGEEAKEISKQVPPSIAEYLKQKEKELELLHAVPTQLNPYYKEEVNKYFQRLNEQ